MPINIIEKFSFYPEILVDEVTKNLIFDKILFEDYIKVQFTFYNQTEISKSICIDNIYLYDSETDTKCKLYKMFNIAKYPLWSKLEPHCKQECVLIFESLPKNCKKFDLIEEAESNPICIKNISTLNSLNCFVISNLTMITDDEIKDENDIIHYNFGSLENN